MKIAESSKYLYKIVKIEDKYYVAFKGVEVGEWSIIEWAHPTVENAVTSIRDNIERDNLKIDSKQEGIEFEL